jgi:hypothetical protein
MRLPLLLPAALLICGAATAQQRVVLYETFTSSTCGPCNPGNANFEGVLDSVANPAQYVSVKYQQNFPGSGDPYCTTEAVSRRSYYSINSIPRLRIDGGFDSNAYYFRLRRHNLAKAVAPTYTITGTYSVINKVVTAKVRWTPLAAYTGEKLYVAIVETTCDNNVKSNGETQFENVMKKMMPHEGGTTVPDKPIGTPDSMTLTFTFAGAYRLPPDGQTANRINHTTEHSVEDFNNLKVVAWMQGTDKKVYQAANLTKVTTGIDEPSKTVGALEVFPNPANDRVMMTFDMKAADEVHAQLISLNGAVVRTSTTRLQGGKQSLSFDTRDLAAGNYTLIVTDSERNVFAQLVTVSH